MKDILVKVKLEEEERIQFKHLCSNPTNVRKGKGDMQKALHDYIRRCLKANKLL